MRYLITSALPYINGMIHLGNLVGSMLPADIFARFLRSEGEDVLLICATDEHGTPAEIAALEAGLDVVEYCNRQYLLQADVYQRFGLSFDHFGRTSAPQNHEVTQRFYLALERNGFIIEKELMQCYSPEDGRFLPDRYVTGTCPRCGYEAARGDQCENCTSLLDPTDLVAPRSAVSGSTAIEFRPTSRLFLDLEALSGPVRAWVESHPEWPRLTVSVATWELFATVVNKDLVGNFGNFVNRTLKLVQSKLGPQVPAGGRPGEREERLASECSEVLDDYWQQLRGMEFRKAVQSLRRLWSLGNVYIDERAPWSLLSSDHGDPDAAAVVLRTAINLARVFAVAAWPVIPFSAETVFDALRLDPGERTISLPDPELLTRLAGGRPFEVPPLLFRRLDEAEVKQLRLEYGG